MPLTNAGRLARFADADTIPLDLRRMLLIWLLRKGSGLQDTSYGKFCGTSLCAGNQVPNAGPNPADLKDAPNLGPASHPLKANRKKSKPVAVKRLYPELEPGSLRHARAVLESITTHCPHIVGSFVPTADLRGSYFEMCELEGWQSYHWTAVARQLGRLTVKRLLKRQGKRFAAYRIPKARKRSRVHVGANPKAH